MTNEEAWRTYVEYTEGLTQQARKVAFGGLAVCWFFREDSGAFPVAILAGMLLLVFFFATDLSQYYLGAKRTKDWLEEEEGRRGSLEGDFSKPLSLDRPVFYLFRVKLMFLVCAFGIVKWHIGATALSQF